jgi:hypothetical protein
MSICFIAAILLLTSLINFSNLRKIFDSFCKAQCTPVVAAYKTSINNLPAIASALSNVQYKKKFLVITFNLIFCFIRYLPAFKIVFAIRVIYLIVSLSFQSVCILKLLILCEGVLGLTSLKLLKLIRSNQSIQVSLKANLTRIYALSRQLAKDIVIETQL